MDRLRNASNGLTDLDHGKSFIEALNLRVDEPFLSREQYSKKNKVSFNYFHFAVFKRASVGSNIKIKTSMSRKCSSLLLREYTKISLT